MLYKYLGEARDQVTNADGPRADCLRNGLFRFTQPALLNDKTSEFRAAVYLNAFSPADYEWAYKRERRMEVNHSYEPSKEELERMFLMPTGERYGDTMPHLLAGEGFQSMQEFDQAQVERIASGINRAVVGLFSAHFGVLSMCEDPVNKLMWTHYGSEGRGLAIGFDETHAFFVGAGVKRVSYNPADRASITYFKGAVRINGLPVRYMSEGLQLQELLKDRYQLQSMFERFVYAKEEVWAYEREHRLLMRLDQRDSEGNPADCFYPVVDPEVAEHLEPYMRLHPRVCLKRIPYDAFKEVLLGYEVSEKSEQKVRDLLDQNTGLKHVILKRIRIDVFGNLVSRQV